MTIDEIAVVLRVAAATGRSPSTIKIGLGLYRDWRRAMDERTLGAYPALPADQRIYGVPFEVDPTLPPGSVEFVGL